MITSIFDTLQTACTERVHSAAIAWLLSSSCEELSDEQKVKCVNALCVVPEGMAISSVDSVSLEEGHIDVLIRGRNGEEKDVLIAIENKIKSREHSDQLSRYQDQLEKSDPDANRQFVYLAIAEAYRPGPCSGWTFARYGDLLNYLVSVCGEDDRSRPIVSAYQQTLRNLTDVFTAFIDSPSDYPSVFSDGWKKKSDKEARVLNGSDGDFATYISYHGLETELQRYFFETIRNRIVDHPHCMIRPEDITITETRGTALMDCSLSHLCSGRISIDGFEFVPQVQFQGESIKLQLDANMLPAPDRPKARGVLEQRIDRIVSIAEDAFRERMGGNAKWRVNRSRSEESAYMSLSRKPWYPGDLPVYGQCGKDIVEEIMREIECAKSFYEEI